MLTLEQKIEEYRILKNDLTNLKADEMALRTEIAEELASNESAGTHNYDFPGMKVKIVTKLNYTIDKTILEAIELTEEEAECIRWKPELNLKKYKGEEETENLDAAIIVKAGAPTITVELSE